MAARLTADGRLQSVTEINTLYDLMDKGKPRPVDEKVMPFLKGEKAQTEVLPLVNNFRPGQQPMGSRRYREVPGRSRGAAALP